MERRAELWRIENGFTYQDLADMAGCSRQYAWNLCHNGTAGITRALKVIALSAGKLDIYDFVSDEEREELIDMGLWPEDRMPEKEAEDLYCI